MFASSISDSYPQLTGYTMSPSHLESSNIRVLPPANGKKRWRVRRLVSAGSLDNTSSLECLNNSLKISAAGSFMMKRPPLKRPKLKPGMPKDFVFVDLSPVKSESDLDVSTEKQSPLSLCNETFSDDELAYQAPLFDENLMGLGLMNMGCEFDEYMAPMPSMVQNVGLGQVTQMSQHNLQGMIQMSQHQPMMSQLQMGPVPVMMPTPPMNTPAQIPHKRSKSAGGFQFKTYTGPNQVKKPRKHKRCVLEPSRIPLPPLPEMETGLEDFLHQPKLVPPYTPLSELSESEERHLDYNQALFFKDEFDLLSFVSL